VLKLSRCVERVDVDDDQASAKYAAHGHRVLEHVWQHDRHSFAARESERLLQVARELHRQSVEACVVERATHIGVSGVTRVFLESLLEEISHRLERRCGNLVRHTGRVGLDPHFFQNEILAGFFCVLNP